METIRKITHINNNIISFKELNKFNDQDVEVIIFPLQENRTVPSKKEFFKYCGAIDSGFTDTSERVDELIYGK